jgi:hypothetical protein
VVDIAAVMAVAVELTGATVTPVMAVAATAVGNVLVPDAATLAFRVTVTG